MYGNGPSGCTKVRSTLRHGVCKAKVNPWYANTGTECRRWCINYHFATRHYKEVDDNTTLRPLYHPQRSCNHCTGWRVDLGASLDGMENLVPPGFDSPIWDMMPHTLVEVHRRFKEICRLQHHARHRHISEDNIFIDTTAMTDNIRSGPNLLLTQAAVFVECCPKKMLICFNVDK